MKKSYNATTIPVFFCDFCMSPISNEEGTARYDVIKTTTGYGYMEKRRLHVCEKCMEEIVRVADRMLKGEL